MKRTIYLFLLVLLGFFLTACGITTSPQTLEDEEDQTTIQIEEDGNYTSKEDVAAYIHTYHELPPNYITKEEAIEQGWEASEGNLWEVTDELSIGGDRFYNREGLLPENEGRIYYEADINYEGGYRGPERLVFSNDGLIYYTPDHYDSFTLLYGDEYNEESYP